MSDVPRLIYIGPADYDLVMKKRIENLGECEDGKILLRSGQNPTAERGTVVHELLHAIFFESGLRKSTGLQLTLETEEEIVNAIAPWIYAVFFQDNPDLNKYLTEKRKEKAA